MDFSKYKNKKPWPKYSDKSDRAKKMREEHKREDSRIYNLFEKDSLEELGLTKHKKADLAFQLAWDRGHSYGYEEVFIELSNLSELLL